MSVEQHDLGPLTAGGAFLIKITVDIDNVEKQFFTSSIMDPHSDVHTLARAALGALATGADAWIKTHGEAAQIPPADPAPTPRTDWQRPTPPTPRTRGKGRSQ